MPQYSKNRAEQVISPIDQITIPAATTVAAADIDGRIHDTVATAVPASNALIVRQRRVRYEITAWRRTMSSASSEMKTSGFSQWPTHRVSGMIRSMAASISPRSVKVST